MRTMLLRGPRSRLWLAWMLVVTAACARGDGSEAPARATRQQCVALRDHLVELRLEGVTADREAHRAGLTSALGDDFLDRCVGDTARAAVLCGLAAKDATALAACTPGTGP